VQHETRNLSQLKNSKLYYAY